MDIGVHLKCLALSEPILVSSDRHFPSKSIQASWTLINLRMSMVISIKDARLYQSGTSCPFYENPDFSRL